MQAILQIIDDDGKVLVESQFNALCPWTHRIPDTQVLREPCVLSGVQAGTYEIHGFTYQPIIRLTGKIGGF